MIEDFDSFGARLSYVMFFKDLTFSDLAKMTEISPATLSRYCAKKRSPTLGNLKKICLATSVDANFLLGLTDVCSFKKE